MDGCALVGIKPRTLKFVETVCGCFVPISHRLTVDGYFRKTWGSSRKETKREAEMFHRFVYRAHKGEIPEDHDIDHTCRNRACCNPNHLECVDGSAHASQSNRDRAGRTPELIR